MLKMKLGKVVVGYIKDEPTIMVWIILGKDVELPFKYDHRIKFTYHDPKNDFSIRPTLIFEDPNTTNTMSFGDTDEQLQIEYDWVKRVIEKGYYRVVKSFIKEVDSSPLFRTPNKRISLGKNKGHMRRLWSFIRSYVLYHKKIDLESGARIWNP